jgi:hypothetical protein
MNIKWVKLLVDGLTNRDYDQTIEALVSRDIMPVIRIYRQCNQPYDPAQLAGLVGHYVAKGVYYYDLYNEPNLPGEAGGWCQPGGEPQPEALALMWAEAARTIYLAGGYPGLPSFFAPDQKKPDWPEAFFYRFFRAVRAQGNEPVLYFSWASIHNYHINHPPTYPYDVVNQSGPPLSPAEIERYQLNPAQVSEMNRNRHLAALLATRPLSAADGAAYGLPPAQIDALNRRFRNGELMGFTLYDDSTAFFHFIAYRNQFYDLFGFDIPLLSTEGGATKGSAEDNRYPAVDGQTVAEWTLWSADYMLDQAPAYYFTTMTWLLAQAALDYPDPVWEGNAWYHDRAGDQEPVVAALKLRPRLAETRRPCLAAEAECLAAKVTPQPEVNLLANYPRPAQDNGRAIQWTPIRSAQPAGVVDYFVAELKAMNLKWVKLAQADRPEVSHRYLIEQLVANQIEPVLRLYPEPNQPYQHLAELLPQATALGGHYFELYQEPNRAGPVSVGRLVELWLLAARQVRANGAHPALPLLAANGTVDEMLFLDQFLAEVQARGQTDLLIGAWLPVQAGVSGAEGAESFTKAVAYAELFKRRFGFYLPVMSSQSAAVAPEDLATRTLAAYHALLDTAPAYLLAHNAGLLANRAGGHPDDRFEPAAWYKDRQGTVLPVVEALKADPRKDEVRR